jgi:hypothetical protein
MTINEIAFEAGRITVDELRKQIIIQGHNLTGSLVKSARANSVVVNDDRAVVRILLNSYGVPLNTGVPAPRIPYGTYTGARVSKYIQGLKTFAKLRFRVTDKQALGIAFAIANKHKKEGMPTAASFRFSKNGLRTRYIEETIKIITKDIQKLIGKLGVEFTKAFK